MILALTVATPETEERLLAVGRSGTAEHVERIVRGWRRMDRVAETREAAQQHACRALHVYPDEDGTVNTATPHWLGERFDEGYSIDVLHPRAR